MNACKICTDPRLYEINTAIIQNGNLTEISRDYNVSYNSLYSHAQNHLPKKMVKVFEKQESLKSADLMRKIDDMIAKSETIFNRNYESNKDLTALKALDSLRSTFQLLLNISAQLHAQKVIELEILKQKSGEGDEAKKAEFIEAIKNLSNEELQVFQRMINKANNGNSDIIVKNNRILSYRSH